LEAKIKATWRVVSQLSELQKCVMKRELPQKYNKLSIPEALKTVKQQLTALASHLRRSTEEAEDIFSTDPSKVYSQWQVN